MTSVVFAFKCESPPCNWLCQRPPQKKIGAKKERMEKKNAAPFFWGTSFWVKLAQHDAIASSTGRRSTSGHCWRSGPRSGALPSQLLSSAGSSGQTLEGEQQFPKFSSSVVRGAKEILNSSSDVVGVYPLNHNKQNKCLFCPNNNHGSHSAVGRNRIFQDVCEFILDFARGMRLQKWFPPS